MSKSMSDKPSNQKPANNPASNPKNNRRAFLKAGGIMTAAALGSAALPEVARGQSDLRNLKAPHSKAEEWQAMPTRNLGKTGYKVGIFSLGGQAALEKANNEAVAVPVIERALDLGVNYVDTSSIYGGPERWSEQYVGKVMKHRRSDAFLATKTKERTREGSMRMIETSLKLLQTDHIDLWQLHTAEDADAAHNSPEALIANPKGDGDGHALKVVALPDGSFSVTNTRTGITKQYPRD